MPDAKLCSLEREESVGPSMCAQAGIDAAGADAVCAASTEVVAARGPRPTAEMSDDATHDRLLPARSVAIGPM
jgi:hypothetical protein